MKATVKQLIFSSILIVFFFGGLEIILALAGVRPILSTDDPLVGFAGNIPLYIEEPQDDGTVMLKTAENKLPLFNAQTFLKIKPENSYRIFCMGGSTTYGRPYLDSTSFCGWLRAFLKAAEPNRQWEVINAGGVSYASYRVARLMNELVQYQPDLFIIYSGQNEFLEQRSYGKLLDLPSWILETDSALSASRTYSALRNLIGQFQSDSQELSKKSRLKDEVDDILGHTLGPTSYQRNDVLKQQILEHYRINLGRMVKIARHNKAGVILVTPVVNLKDMSPFKSEHKEGLSSEELLKFTSLVQNANVKFFAENYIEALALFHQAEEIDDRYADLHYRIGQTLFALKRYDESEMAFWRAVDEDVAPLRILSSMKSIVSDVASASDTPLVDFNEILVKAYLEKYDHAVFGKEIFLDHVHPNIEGYRLLGLALLEKLINQGIVFPEPSWSDERITAVSQQVIAELDIAAHSEALRNLGRVLDWGGKFDEAQNLFFQRLKLIGSDVETYALLGKNAYRNNNVDEAIYYFNKAVAMEPDNLKAHLWLGDLYRIKNNNPEAIYHYSEGLRINNSDHVIHDKLGVAYALNGNYEQAEQHFNDAIQLNPGFESSVVNLLLLNMNQNKLNEGIDFGNKMLVNNPESYAIHNQLGVIYGANGDFKLAAENFSAALRIYPDYKIAQNNLKIAEEKSKQQQTTRP